MIVSASRRTDIPAFYSEWFFNRLREGYVLVRNPMNPHRISRISLKPDVVDGIVFWTKNPAPMLERLDGLSEYPYYFQLTLNPYGKDVESMVPSKGEVLLPAFRSLAEKIGKERVLWRYDPILFSEKYTMEYHLRYFQLLASKLAGFTELCTVSFLDFYRNTAARVRPLGLIRPTPAQEVELIGHFAGIARESGIKLRACAEDVNFEKLGVRRACCVDAERLGRLGSCCHLAVRKDRNQRPLCGCDESVDIGAYHTCAHGCLYCYANSSPTRAQSNFAAHDPCSPLLFGHVGNGDVVGVPKLCSCRDGQLRF